MSRAIEMKKYYREIKQLPIIDSFVDNGYKNELRGNDSFLVIITYNLENKIEETTSTNIFSKKELLNMFESLKVGKHNKK